MNSDDTKKRQREERKKCVEQIVQSSANKKLIVAGAGTGKTFTFATVINTKKGGNNLAITFIRKLVVDMDVALKGNAEVKTFHAYCKKVLHQKRGGLELVHFLPELIRKDAAFLGKAAVDFAAKFRMLEEGEAIAFYLDRAGYYNAVGFDDAVYCLFKEVQSHPEALPQFDQIVVDEFQDFNPLEVAFIEELSKKGDILVVGDDDQAVYDDRSASPDYLRKLYASGEFAKFELPFCGRCTEVVVEATNCLLKQAAKLGCLKGRIEKRYECYLDDKEADSKRYPKIITANCTTVGNLPKYILREIERIDSSDIADSHIESKEYPTVLIVGKGHYLREIHKQLRLVHKQITYVPSSGSTFGIGDAYAQLIPDEKSNLGWRLLLELLLDEPTQREVITNSAGGKPIADLLPRDFVKKHMRIIELARSVQTEGLSFSEVESEIQSTVGDEGADAIQRVLLKPHPPRALVDKKLPTISLTSFKGCKGLSAGHVFIVGVHNGCMPKDNDHVTDVEISQFIVALTRTRKQCHILSNDWWTTPRNEKGWVAPFEPSILLDWIPGRLKEDRGKLRAADLK